MPFFRQALYGIFMPIKSATRSDFPCFAGILEEFGVIKGLLFFIKFGWRHEKRYLVYLVLNQFITALIPIVAVVMPRYI